MNCHMANACVCVCVVVDDARGVVCVFGMRVMAITYVCVCVCVLVCAAVFGSMYACVDLNQFLA